MCLRILCLDRGLRAEDSRKKAPKDRIAMPLQFEFTPTNTTILDVRTTPTSFAVGIDIDSGIELADKAVNPPRTIKWLMK